MISCTKRLTFAAGHRVWNHESKCANLHGHNYAVLLEAVQSAHLGLDQIGRVIDFSVLKAKFSPWIEQFWDHGFIIHEQDSDARAAMQQMDDQKFFQLPYNPTAENLARYLMDLSETLLEGTGVTLRKVTVWETETCFAEVTR